jgi:hypothetical protein
VLKFRPGWQEETIKGPLFSSLLSKTNDRGPVLSDWRDNYNYVLLLNADMSPKYPLDNDGLELISGGGFAKVFRVNR